MNGMQMRSILLYFVTYVSLLLGILLFLGIDITRVVAVTVFWCFWIVLLSLVRKHEYESHERARKRTLEPDEEDGN